MKALVLAAAAASVLAGTAAAQAYDPYGQPKKHNAWAPPAPPKAPQFPKPPQMPQAPGFKPFEGEHVYSPRGGVNSYPAPAKPKAPRGSPYYGSAPAHSGQSGQSW